MEGYMKRSYQNGKKTKISELLLKNDSFAGLLLSIPQTQFTSRRVSKRHPSTDRTKRGLKFGGKSTQNLKKRILATSGSNGFLFGKDDKSEAFHMDFMKKKLSSKTKR